MCCLMDGRKKYERQDDFQKIVTYKYLRKIIGYKIVNITDNQGKLRHTRK